MDASTSLRNHPPRLGAHFSIAGGLDQAVYAAARYGCTALQLFTKNASTWKERILAPEEVQDFEKAKRDTGIRHVASHAAYLLNLASPEPRKHRISVDALTRELLRSAALSIPYVILHPGNHMEAGLETGIRNIVEGLNAVFDAASTPRTRLLLETTAGQGTSVGSRFEEIRDIMDGLKDPARVGTCLDTSHIFAAGYDIRTRNACEKTLAEFDAVIGLHRLAVIHLNDTHRALGSRVDRHAHIGEGQIGLEAFRCFMRDARFEAVLKIIETPKTAGGADADRMNLDRLRSLLEI